jgi:hypothetical protein
MKTKLVIVVGEFLLPKTGGTANIDGVEVQQFVEDYPEYELNQEYVLLITLYPSGVARTFGGLSVSLRFFRTTNLHQSVRANIRFAKISKTCLATHLIK